RFSPSLLLKAVSDPTFSEIIGCHLDQNLVARKHPDAVLAHSPRRVRDDLVFVLELHPERGVREEFRHNSRKLQHLFLRHKAPSASKFGGEWSQGRTKSRPIPAPSFPFSAGLDSAIQRAAAHSIPPLGEGEALISSAPVKTAVAPLIFKWWRLIGLR